MRSIFYSLLVAFLFFSCSPNNVKKDKGLAKYFEENKVEGCFALMDNGTGKFTVHNLARYRDSNYLPASTFKIVNSLIGLQTGKISGDSMVIKWDGVKRRDAWDKDLIMYDAFRVSSVPYYQEVARRIGRDTMQFWLDSLGYGTKKITGPIDSFWLNNTLKIKPDEELGLVKRLYFDQLPFFASYQKIVKRAMLFENNANYRLGYKTGWGYTEKGNALGWVVGWIEENKHPYFFVLNIESPDKNIDMVKVRMQMLKDILKYLGFFDGKM
ncbi:MAG TPA: penicillin-binding transpeptidase domain-containing protein [Chitinophagaceae bacterium]|jgi:beta-lactamase class D|nr:penicillin-binding transpeptidase domain-containing protein [Chitinophagaceae bacterium]